MMDIRFENANTADIPVILEQAKALVYAYEDLSSIDYDKVVRWMEQKIKQNISDYQCAVVDGKRCAYWHLCEDGEVDDVYVLPAYQSCGIGSAILKKCIEESNESLWLYVFSHNKGAISFYERFGFSVRETVGRTRLIMERKG